MSSILQCAATNRLLHMHANAAVQGRLVQASMNNTCIMSTKALLHEGTRLLQLSFTLNSNSHQGTTSPKGQAGKSIRAWGQRPEHTYKEVAG